MRWPWAWPALTLLLVCEAGAVDRGPPYGASMGAARENVERTVGLLRRQAPGLGLENSLIEELADCDRWQAAVCDATSAGDCAHTLAEIFDALSQGLVGRPLATDGTRMVDGARRTAAMEIAGTLSRLSWIAGTDHGSADCLQISPATTLPAEVILHPDLRTIDVRPLVPLEAGKRYRVLAPGLSGERRASLTELLAADFDPAAAKSELDATFAPPRANRGHPIDVAALRELLAQISGASISREDVGVLSGLRATSSRGWSGAELASLPLAFEAESAVGREHQLAEIRTLDPTQGVARPRGPCRILAAHPSSEPEILAGSATAGSQQEQVPFLLALPAELDADTALVFGLDGHQGSAARMMARHRAGVTGRGMALLTLDLPLHGQRIRTGEDFVPLLDPLQLASNFRRAVGEILSVMADARGCGFELRGARRWKPSEIRYLGYSLGSLLGTAVRATDPELGATALLAPGGDLFSWLQLRIGPEMGTTFVRCLGGPTEGQPCHETGACDAPGVCIVAPEYAALVRLLERPWSLVTADAEPLAFASVRGNRGRAPLLLVAGGEDPVFHPALIRRLADAYRMRPVGSGVLRGPASTMVIWPHLLHDLEHPAVHDQVHDFLQARGRTRPQPQSATIPPRPAWYEVFQPARR